jgi:hypothetical protein
VTIITLGFGTRCADPANLGRLILRYADAADEQR